jgi:hypothetical protein
MEFLAIKFFLKMSYFEKILNEESPKLKVENIFLEPIDVPFTREEIEAEIARQEKLNPIILVKNSNDEEKSTQPPLIFNPMKLDNEASEKESSQVAEKSTSSRGRRSNLNDQSNRSVRSVSNVPDAEPVKNNLEKSHSSKAVAIEVPIQKVKNIPIELEISKNVKDYMAQKAIEAIKKSTITNSKYRMGCSILTGDDKIITG